MNRYRVQLVLKILLSFLLVVCLRWPEARAFEIMQPRVYREGIDVSGWMMSEKLDGVRGYWDGRQLLSKTGLPFHPPASFTENFPDFALEGEIWGGRGTFEKTMGIVKQQETHDGWLLVELPESRIRFKIGTGFSDAIRENPPPIGSLITFKYCGFYASGIPKFPSFFRIREPY
jgi:ATP-dependent DNA ligase